MLSGGLRTPVSARSQVRFDGLSFCLGFARRRCCLTGRNGRTLTGVSELATAKQPLNVVMDGFGRSADTYRCTLCDPV
jgi:hypothetical protein